MASFAELLLKRTGLGTLKGFYEHCRKPMETQQKLLQDIIRNNMDTAYGKKHNFNQINSISDFQKKVPVQTYEDLQPYIDAALNGESNQLTAQAPVLYATTSGTTGIPKYIPVNKDSKNSKSQLMRVWLSKIVQDHPSVLSGRIFTMVSPEVEGYSPAGTPWGSESGHGYRSMPKMMQVLYSAPYEVFEIKDYDAKYYSMLRIGAGQDVTILYTVNPSTVLLLAQRLGEYSEPIIRDIHDGTLSKQFDISAEIRAIIQKGLKPDPKQAKRLEKAAAQDGKLLPKNVWPNMQMIGCWKGGSVGMYLKKFPQYYPEDIAIRDIGYFSSENRGSVPLSDRGASGVLAVPTNLYEFSHVDDTGDDRKMLTIDQLEEEEEYYIYVTTEAGLYRYEMNDIIKVHAFFENTPIIRFIQKGKGMVSFTGEKLAEVQVIKSVEQALESISGQYEFIAAVGEVIDTTPQYKFLIEFEKPPTKEDARRFAKEIDYRLGIINIEYSAKRVSGRILPCVLAAIPGGEFNKYRKRMVDKGRLDGQFKILRLTKDTSFGDEFKIDFTVSAK